MIHWIYENVNHITAPFGVLLALMTVVMVTIDQRKKKAGELDGIGRGYRFAAMVILFIAFIFAGIVLVHNFA